jgi:hypothetical protein
MITTGQAVASLRPGIEWTMNGDDVEGIIWHTPNVTPLTQAEVEAEVARLEQEEINKEEQRIAALESAKTKLASLGLSDIEVDALMNNLL